MKFSQSKGFIDRESFVAQYLALALFTIGVASTIGSDDLLAAFAAGMLTLALLLSLFSTSRIRLCYILGRSLQYSDRERDILFGDRLVVKLRVFCLYWCLAPLQLLQHSRTRYHTLASPCDLVVCSHSSAYSPTSFTVQLGSRDIGLARGAFLGSFRYVLHFDRSC